MRERTVRHACSKVSLAIVVLATLAMGLALAAVAARPASAANPSGDLSIAVIAAPNLVVDSNIESPSGYGPEAAHLGAKVCNTGTDALTDVFVAIGNFDPNGDNNPADSTPGKYPSRTHAGLTGSFSLTHEGGTADATRYIRSLAAGECTTQYWLVGYPRLDSSGHSVTGGTSPTDDLWLNYDIWSTGIDPLAGPLVADVTETVHMRNEISAMANKIWPNNTAKVPDAYLNAFEQQLGWRPDQQTYGAGGSANLQGIWYDLGNIGQGFDADGDFQPDYDLWMQPVGDPNLYDASCTRLVKVHGVLVIKLNDGTDQVIAFENQLYFKDISPNNNGAVGLVFYEFITINGNCSSTLSPYQEVASGSNNEKFNGDYGTNAGTITALPPQVSFDKSGSATVAPSGNAQYALSTTNNAPSGAFGAPLYGTPLVMNDSIPDGLVYVAGSATAANTVPPGSTVSVVYSVDHGLTWSTTEPPAANVTNLAWNLNDPLAAGQTVTVRFEATVPTTPTSALIQNTGTASVGSGTPFATDSTVTLVTGSRTISGTVFADDGGTTGTIADGIQSGGELGIANVAVTLYVDLDNDGTIDATDLQIASTSSAANGSYSFGSLPDGSFLVAVDPADPDVPTSWGMTTTEVRGATVNGANVTGMNYGFAPAVDVTKTLVGTSPVAEGDTVNFNVTVRNRLAAAAPPDPCSPSCDLWSTALYGAGNNMTNAANAAGSTEPNGSVAVGDWQGARGVLETTSFAPPTSAATISKVEVVTRLRLTGSLSNDYLNVVTNWNGGSRTDSLSTSTLNGIGTTFGTVATDVTAAKTWTWADLANPATYLHLETVKVSGPDAPSIEIDAVGFRVTTISTVPSGGVFNVNSTLDLIP